MYNLQNIKTTKSETCLVSLAHAIKARNKQVAKEKLYIFPSYPYAMCPPPNHSRPQSLRFFWSHGRRNGGLRSQRLPDVCKSQTSGNACIILARVTAHAQKLIPREGREESIVFLSVNRSDFEEALTVFSSLKLWSVM